MKVTKLSILFLLVLTVNLSWSQAIMNIPLRSVFSNEEIAANTIRSVVVFADLYEEDEEYPGGINGKIAEIEFDSRGYQCYRRVINDLKDLPFLTYGSSDRMEELYFDDAGELRYLYRENKEEVYQFIDERDELGNLVQLVILTDDEIKINHHFTWENGKMIRFENLGSSVDEELTYTYDDQIRDCTISSAGTTGDEGEDYLVVFDYEQFEDTIFYTETVIISGDTVVIDSAQFHEEFEHRYDRYKSYNDRGELVVDMTVRYDEQGNATHYDLINRGDRRSTQVKKEEEYYRIDNIYDERNLLVSRKFYSVQDESEQLVRVERMFYSTQGLDVKLKKCQLDHQSLIKWAVPVQF